MTVHLEEGLRGRALKVVWHFDGEMRPAYELDGPELDQLRDTSSDARRKLEELVYEMRHRRMDSADPLSRDEAEALSELLRHGVKLRQAILTPSDSALLDLTEEIGQELAELGSGATFRVTMSTEFHVPWTVVAEEGLGDSMGAFWGNRFRIQVGRPVHRKYWPKRVEDPAILFVLDPVLGESLGIMERYRRLAAHPRIDVVTSWDEAKARLMAHPVGLVYWLSHATARQLRLGEAEVKHIDVKAALQRAEREHQCPVRLVMLNACHSGGQADDREGSFVSALLGARAGGILTESVVSGGFARDAGDRLLRALLTQQQDLGTILAGLRTSDLRGLVYGLYASHDLIVENLDQAARVSLTDVLSVPGTADARADVQMLTNGAIGSDEVRRAPPPRPYPELDPYDAEYQDLFVGRDREVDLFLETLNEPSTRLILLHGQSGAGKSSFLRAGVIPALDGPYRPLPSAGALDETGAEAALFIRCTNQPLRQLAVSLARYGCAPGPGREHLERALHDRFSTVDPVAIGDALIAKPTLLADLLTAWGRVLPYTFVLFIDQSEEVFTLAAAEHKREARAFFSALVAAADEGSPGWRIVVSLRTEYYGRLLGSLRDHQAGPIAMRDFWLDEISEERTLLRIIEKPTSDIPIDEWEPVDGAPLSPRRAYGEFRFGRGVAATLAKRLASTSTRDGLLPLLQIVCARLHAKAVAKSEKSGKPPVVEEDMLLDEKGGKTTFHDYLSEFWSDRVDALAIDGYDGTETATCVAVLLEQLVVRRGAALSTERRTADELLGPYDARCDELNIAEPVRLRALLDALVAAGLLRPHNEIVGRTRIDTYRLRHDTLSGVVLEWSQAQARASARRERSRVVGYQRGSYVAALAMVGLSLLVGRQWHTAETTQATIDHTQNALDAAQQQARLQRVACDTLRRQLEQPSHYVSSREVFTDEDVPAPRARALIDDVSRYASDRCGTEPIGTQSSLRSAIARMAETRRYVGAATGGWSPWGSALFLVSPEHDLLAMHGGLASSVGRAGVGTIEISRSTCPASERCGEDMHLLFIGDDSPPTARAWDAAEDRELTVPPFDGRLIALGPDGRVARVHDGALTIASLGGPEPDSHGAPLIHPRGLSWGASVAGTEVILAELSDRWSLFRRSAATAEILPEAECRLAGARSASQILYLTAYDGRARAERVRDGCNLRYAPNSGGQLGTRRFFARLSTAPPDPSVLTSRWDPEPAIWRHRIWALGRDETIDGIPTSSDEPICSAAFVGGGLSLTATRDGTVDLFSRDTQDRYDQLGVFHQDVAPYDPTRATPPCADPVIEHLALSPDGACALVVGHEPGAPRSAPLVARVLCPFEDGASARFPIDPGRAPPGAERIDAIAMSETHVFVLRGSRLATWRLPDGDHPRPERASVESVSRVAYREGCQLVARGADWLLACPHGSTGSAGMSDTVRGAALSALRPPLALGPNGAFAASHDGRLHVWFSPGPANSDRSCMSDLSGAARALAFEPRGGRLIALDDIGASLIGPGERGRCVTTRVDLGSTADVIDLQLSTDSLFVLRASGIESWSTDGGWHRVDSLQTGSRFEGERPLGWLSPFGRVFMQGAGFGRIAIAAPGAAAELGEHAESLGAVGNRVLRYVQHAFAPDASRVALVTDTGWVRVHELATNRLVTQLCEATDPADRSAGCGAR
ncbi:MAG: hypothetical protein AB7S26_40200 [Sandaracinaceae bacterium]